jgi:hypothetical protein
LGFLVDGIDISQVALSKLATMVDKDRVNLIEADLDSYSFESEQYGLAIMSNFFDKEVIQRAKESLVVGGIFVVESYLKEPIEQKRAINSAFLLQKDELKEIFSDFEILEYKEFEHIYKNQKVKKAAIAVVKV